MNRASSPPPPYRSDLAAALQRLDALKAHETDCEACAERAERRARRGVSLAKLGRSVGAMVVGLVFTVVGVVALLTATLAVVLLLADASGSVTTCADFGCGFNARPANIPSEAATALTACLTVWASAWGVGRCLRWARGENTRRASPR